MDITRKDTEAVTHDVKITGNEHLKDLKKYEIFKEICDNDNFSQLKTIKAYFKFLLPSSNH